MQKSESITELAKALSVAQGEIQNAKKDSENPFFKSRYADLAAVRESIQAPFAKNGLAVLQLPRTSFVDNSLLVTVETILTHASGEWIAGELSAIPTKSDAQGIGSAITYLRRYGLSAIAGVASEADDDGNAASTPTQAVQAPAPKRAANLAKTPLTPVTAEVQALRDQIKAAMAALNAAGDTPEWTVERVNVMSKENFNGKTTAQLTEAELGDFAKMFSQRMEMLRTKSTSNREALIANIRNDAEPQVITDYLAQYFEGRKIEELTDSELQKMELEVSVPF